MAEVTLEIGGRSYAVACRDGEEDHLLGLGQMVNSKAQDAGRAMGSMTENRQLLVTALLLADAMNEPGGARSSLSQPSAEADEDMAIAIEQLAERMEKLAIMLETGDPNA